MTTPNKDRKQLAQQQKRKYMRIVLCLWQNGPEVAHEDYPDISVEQFKTADKYYDSKRCEGCRCGSCVNLPELAANLDTSPKPLEPIAKLAQRLGEEELARQAT